MTSEKLDSQKVAEPIAGAPVAVAAAPSVVSQVAEVKKCNAVNITVNSTIGVGVVALQIHHEWAPLGAARFCELVESKFYDEVRFFRVLKVSAFICAQLFNIYLR